MENPYDGYGVHAAGPRFVGRHRERQELERHLRRMAGGVSISGLGKVGKTSLILSVFNAPNVLPDLVCRAYVCASLNRNASSLYYTALTELVRDATDRGMPIPLEVQTALTSQAKDLDGAFRFFQLALEGWKAKGIRCALVIDEFDGVLDFESGDTHVFIQQLRYLLDIQDKSGLHCTFVSRRSLYHIERKTPSISNLFGLCKSLNLKMFSLEEVRELIDRCAPDWTLSGQDEARLWQLTGGYPYLAEMILCESFDSRSVDLGFEKARGACLILFDRIRLLLAEDGLWEALIIALFTVSPKPSLIEATQRLRDYGIFSLARLSTGPSRTSVFSEAFQVYVEAIARSQPYSDLWRETENLLRRYVGRRLTVQYGEQWLEKLKSKHVHFKDLLTTKWEPVREKETRVFGNDASVDILDYSYVDELWQLICWEWPLFKAAFRDKGTWQEKFTLMTKVRNTDFHSRMVPDSPLARASEYCKELQGLLESE